jgi:hypothetical protein
MKNIHDKSIPKDLIDQALAKINEADALLAEYLDSLSPEDRQTLFKMGDKSVAFVEKTVELAAINPKFAPSYFKLDELKIDLEDVVNLRALANRLQQLSRKVEDTAMLAGSEAIAQSLTYYNSVKQATRDNVSESRPLFEELKKRFVFGGRSKKNTEQE